MCSIMGYFKTNVSRKRFEKAFEKTRSRGPDATRIIDTGNGFLGFHRLAIMGLDENGMQPFIKNNRMLVCNGEIYGFRKLRQELIQKGYHFESESDCEILLPLYEELGCAMFEQLDAEFALIMYDGNLIVFLQLVIQSVYVRFIMVMMKMERLSSPVNQRIL